MAEKKDTGNMKYISVHEPQLISLRNGENGISAEVCSIGASLAVLEVPLPDGGRRDVVLGYEDMETYFHNEPHLGATVAPFANRIGGAAFSLNGESYSLEKNDGENCLHGGSHFLQDYLWKTTAVSDNSVTFSADCKDGENGFPGPVHLDVTYTVKGCTLLIDYHGSALRSEKDVLFNPTNHSYFNLNGKKSSSVLGHRLTVFSDRITPAGREGVPDGTVLDVSGTPFDFRKEKTIGERINAEEPLLRRTNGYDHNYILSKCEELHEREYDLQSKREEFKRQVYLAARLRDASGEVTMDVLTDMPGLQLYTANFLEVHGTGKDGADYHARSAVCLETQYYPNAVNVPSFPQPVIRAGKEAYSRTVFRF